jgi:hypothetical protein
MNKPAPWLAAFPEQRCIPPVKHQRRSWISSRRLDEQKIYSVRHPLFLRENPDCQRCGRPAQCIHHWAGRRSNFLREETWRASCYGCNDFAKQHPQQARDEKWIAPVGIYKT